MSRELGKGYVTKVLENVCVGKGTVGQDATNVSKASTAIRSANLVIAVQSEVQVPFVMRQESVPASPISQEELVTNVLLATTSTRSAFVSLKKDL